jgi:hypothetical protein
MRRMKIRMELTEASVTEDITPFERERLREALEVFDGIQGDHVG